MNTIDIVFTIDNNFVVPAYIAIYSLFEQAGLKTKYHVIIIYKKISKRYIEMIQRLTINTIHKVSFLKINKLKNDLYTPVTSHIWPEVVYYRLYLPDILKNFDKVIFSDVDILFQDDLSEVWKTDIEEYEIAAVPAEKNNSEMIIHNYFECNSHEYIFMTGFMILNLKLMRKKNWNIKCNENILKYQKKISMYDLDIINLTAENIKPIPFRYVYLQSLYDADNMIKAIDYKWLCKIYNKEYLKKERENIVIIHYAGSLGKPWLRKKVPLYYKQYMGKLPFLMKVQNKKNSIEERLRKRVACIVKKIRLICVRNFLVL